MSARRAPQIRVQGLSKDFPAAKNGPVAPVFQDVSFHIDPGEFVCVIGHSGCGKTTLLKILAGLEEPTAGAVQVQEREIAGPGLDRAVIFQGHALLPWQTVRGNVAFAVESRWPDWPKAKLRAHCQRYIDLVHLSGAEDRRPAELSGGMKQRVGIARALSIEPQVLLMDEPFSALDALTRGVLQDEMLRLCLETRQTVFMITHDVDEAILLADRILLMSNGPRAAVAEIVVNTLPRDRTRQSILHHAHYYRIRNHLIEFLVERSKAFDRDAAGYDARYPPVVRPGEGDLTGIPDSASGRRPRTKAEASRRQSAKAPNLHTRRLR